MYIPEIGTTFHCPSSFRVFCAQNPLGEGGGRKGLPQSFLTRFSKVFVEAMTVEDMCNIGQEAFATKLPIAFVQLIPSMVEFVHKIQIEASNGNTSFGRVGSPWEFNLRDLFRWCGLLSSLCTV